MKQPTQATVRAAGRYLKETDPDMVRQLKAEGFRTELLNLGAYMAETDPDTFQRFLDDQQEPQIDVGSAK